jgi:hypothetical protein
MELVHHFPPSPPPTPNQPPPGVPRQREWPLYAVRAPLHTRPMATHAHAYAHRQLSTLHPCRVFQMAAGAEWRAIRSPPPPDTPDAPLSLPPFLHTPHGDPPRPTDAHAQRASSSRGPAAAVLSASPRRPSHVVRMARFRGRGARAGTLTRTTPRRTERAPHCRYFPAPRPLLQLTSTTAPRHITMVAARCQFQTSGITGWRGGGFVTKIEREHIFSVRAAHIRP